MDAFDQFKANQKAAWANFALLESLTATAAPHLVRFAGIKPGQKVLDVGCGTGVVTLTALRAGAQAQGIDLTPELVARARENAALMKIDATFQEGDAENLPFPDATFDVVISQFGHMFAPRPDVATKEMLRVLKPGGGLAFATWPAEQLVGRSVALTARYVPPPAGVPSPMLWGDISVLRDRLGDAVKDIDFERGIMPVPSLSPRHFMAWQQAKIGPFIKTLGALQKDPEKRDAYLKESEELINSYFVDNIVRHEYLLTRGVKA